MGRRCPTFIAPFLNNFFSSFLSSRCVCTEGVVAGRSEKSTFGGEQVVSVCEERCGGGAAVVVVVEAGD